MRIDGLPVTLAILTLVTATFSFAQEEEPDIAGGAAESADEAVAADDPDAEDDSPAAETEPPEEEGDEAIEEEDPIIDLDDPDFADLDIQTYEEDDDDFVPTEEIPADQAIPFPSDI